MMPISDPRDRIFYPYHTSMKHTHNFCHDTGPVALQFNYHKSVHKLFHNLHILIFSNSLMGFKVICQFEKEPLKGPANVQEIFSYFFGDRFTMKVSRTSIHTI